MTDPVGGKSSIANFRCQIVPYPGLRPYEFHEADLFFGRAEHIDQMLTKLEVSRFLAVVGASGSGKSSLVRAGLLPAVVDGYLSDTGTDWRLIQMRPGSDPFSRLAEAFHEAIDSGDSHPHAAAMTEATLTAGPHGLLQAIADAAIPDDVNILLLVDQFEEIFRFRRNSDHVAEVDSDAHRASYEHRNRAAAFVNLFLETARQSDRPVHVVLTMRSDFLGDCEVFFGLPEAINDAQFLTPRMTRDQIHEAIVKPARRDQMTVEPALVNQILNDVGTDPDQLPLMQHALLRLWITAKMQDGSEGLRLHDYREIGGVENALSRHVDKAYGELPDHLQPVARHLFCCLCSHEADRWTRRMVTVQEVAEVADVDVELVANTVGPFQMIGRNFIVSSPSGSLKPESVLDISHEALIRQWDKLRTWNKRELESASIYTRIADGARLRDRFQTDGHEIWLVEPELNLAVEWFESEQPTKTWGLRYDPDFDLAISFLNDSQQHDRQLKRAAIRRRRIWQGSIAAVVMIIGVALFSYARWADAAATRAAIAKVKAERAELRQQIKGDLVEAESKLRDGHLPGALFSYWDAYKKSLELPNEPRGKSARKLLSAWNRRLKFSLFHDDAVNGLAVSPARNLMVTCSGKVARVWEINDGRPIGDPILHDGNVIAATFSPDGEMLLTGCEDRSARLWNTKSGQLIRKVEHTERVCAVAFSPDGKLFATGVGDFGGKDGEAQIWHTQTGKPKFKTPLKHKTLGVSCLAFDPIDGRTLVTGGWNRTIRFWQTDTGAPRPTADGQPQELKQEGWILSLAISPDGKTIASGSGDNTARLWDFETGKPRLDPRHGEIIKLSHDGIVDGVAFSGDSTKVLTGSRDNTASVWDVKTGHRIGESLRHDDWVHCVAFHPDTDEPITGSQDRSVRLWRNQPLELVRSLKSGGTVLAVAISPDGKTIATSGGTFAYLWNAKSGEPLQRDADGNPVGLKHQYRVRGLAFSPNSKILLTCSGDFESSKEHGAAHFFRVSSGEQLAPPIEHKSPVNAIAYHPNGKSIMTRSVSTVELWNVDPIESPVLATRTLHFGYGTAGVFSPNGKVVFSGSGGQTARLWNLIQASDGLIDSTRLEPAGEPAGVQLRHGGWVTSVAMCLDGMTLLTGSSDHTARLWNAKTCLPAGNMMWHKSSVNAVSFSPDGEWILTASGTHDWSNSAPLDTSSDGEAQLWDTLTQQALGAPLRHPGPVLSAAIAPDGQTLITGCGDGVARVWKIPVDLADDVQHIEILVESRTGLVASGDGTERLTQAEWLKQFAAQQKLEAKD